MTATGPISTAPSSSSPSSASAPTSRPTTQDATRIIETQLSAYAERVAAARTNRRLGQPVGAAYMRAASAQMRDEILPAATTVWRDAAVRLQDDYETGTSSSWPIAFGVAGGVVALGLVALSVFLTLRTRRLLNLGVLVATVLLLAAVSASLVLVAHQHDSLMRAQEDGSDPAQMLSVAHFLALQGQADANLALGEQGTGEAYVEEFQTSAARVGGAGDSPGLIDEARTIALCPAPPPASAPSTRRSTHYLAVAQGVREMDDEGRPRRCRRGGAPG